MKNQVKVLAFVPSSSKEGKTYEIRKGSDNRVYCTCPSWKFNKGETKTCKHIEAIRS